jgi:hypothetical protein
LFVFTSCAGRQVVSIQKEPGIFDARFFYEDLIFKQC